MRLGAVTVVVALLIAARGARADDAEAAFRAATQQLARGELEAAQAAFEAVANADPQGAWADDALAEAAETAERRDDLASARRLWRRVLDEHGSSRQARRARVRIAEIEHAIGAGGQWLAVAERHEQILREAVGKSDPSAQVRELEELVAANPEYPRATDARMWIGETWLRLGFPRRAADVFRAARDVAPAGEPRWRAGKALGDALAAAGALDDAEAVYRALVGEGDALADRVLAEELEHLDTIRARARLILIAWIGLALAVAFVLAHAWLAAGGPRAAARALARPPLEVWFFLPVAAVLVFVAFSGNYLVERAVRWILLGGLAITWLGGASLELARRRGRVRLPILAAHLAAAALAVASICYLAIMNDRLIDMLTETWQHGPDR
jgi:tetratricopeptide (TPR) repeat protein